MRGHPASENRRHAIRVAAEKGIPFVPFKPDEFRDWTLQDVNALPELKSVPPGWEVIGHDFCPPTSDAELSGWSRDTEHIFEMCDADGDVVGMMVARGVDCFCIHYLKAVPVVAVPVVKVTEADLQELDRALFEQRGEGYVAAGFKVDTHTVALKDGE